MMADDNLLKNKNSFNQNINSEKAEEHLTKEEIKSYDENFIQFIDKNNNKLTKPCYKDSNEMEQFLDKLDIEIKEFPQDNDVNTDEEQLQLEIERNNNSLLDFMNNVNKDHHYVDNNISRKIGK